MSRDRDSRPDPGQAPSRSRAARQIDGFERRFGRAHVDFACHAAVPVALTAELAYKLWATFPVDTLGARIEAPWIAVADLLLSDLCTEIAPELYEVRPAVRKLLVARLRAEPRFGEPRLREVATFLLEAAESSLRGAGTDSGSAHGSLATSQRWAALAYTDAERAAALIADAMKELSAADPAAWARLDALLANLAEPLADHAALSAHAAAMASFARGNVGALAEHVQARGAAVSVAGRVVEVPREALSALAKGEARELQEAETGESLAEGPEAELRAPSLRVNLVRAEGPQAEEPAVEEPLAEPSPSAAPQLVEDVGQGTGATSNERPLGDRLTVFVVGTGHGDGPLAEELRPTAESLGSALARAGHTLLTGGWPGIDEMVAKAFVDALSPGDDSARRLRQITAGGRRPAFSGGGWLQVAADTDVTEALARSRAVVVIGGREWTKDVLQLADQLGRPIFPLRWTGGSARDFEPVLADEVLLWHSRRVRGILGTELVATLPADRWLVPVIELANPAKARAFREYNDLLADFLQVLDPVITFREVVQLKGYWAELAEAGSGGVPGSRMAELAAERLVAIAARCPVWVFHDLAQLSTFDSWDARNEARRVLIKAAATHARPHVADIVSVVFRGRSPPGLTDETRELLLAVRAHLAGAPDQRAEGEPDRATAYLHWLRPIVAAWSPVVLAGTVEMSERGNSMVEALRAASPAPSPDFLKPLLESPDRNERVAGYLWTCAFPAVEGDALSFDVALDREIADADSWGTPWALRWLAHALIEHDRGRVPENTERRTSPVEVTLSRLHRFWRENPQLDLQGDGAALIERSLGRDRLWAFHFGKHDINSQS